MSWENDGDSLRTETMNYADKDDTEAMIAIIKLFDESYQIHNVLEPTEFHASLIAKLGKQWVEKYPKVFDKYFDNDFDVNSQTDMSDMFMELLADFGLSGGDYFTRTLKEYRVFYTPVDIILDIVTETF